MAGKIVEPVEGVVASNADQQMDLKTKIYFAKFKKDVKREIFKTDLCDFTKKW